MKLKFMTLFLLSLFGCSKNKLFISSNNWFKLYYPSHWSQFVEDDGTYLFFDNTNWKGNLRITAMRFPSMDPLNRKNKIDELLLKEYSRFQGSKWIIIKDYKSLHYTREFKENDDLLLIHTWFINIDKTLFHCSFTINKSKVEDKDVGIELKHVVKTLESIQLINAL